MSKVEQFEQLKPEYRQKTLESIDSLITGIFKLKHENEVKMNTISSFGLDAHL